MARGSGPSDHLCNDAVPKATTAGREQRDGLPNRGGSLVVFSPTTSEPRGRTEVSPLSHQSRLRILTSLPRPRGRKRYASLCEIRWAINLCALSPGASMAALGQRGRSRMMSVASSVRSPALWARTSAMRRRAASRAGTCLSRWRVSTSLALPKSWPPSGRASTTPSEKRTRRSPLRSSRGCTVGRFSNGIPNGKSISSGTRAMSPSRCSRGEGCPAFTMSER